MKTVMCNGQQISPSKIVCIGRNYVDHIKELNNEVSAQMVVFNKPNSAITTALTTTHNDDALHFETELCFLIKQGKPAAVALGLDLTKRDVQAQLKAKGLPWERAKAFNGAALFSEFVELDDYFQRFTFELTVNNEIKQQGDTDLMLYPLAKILSELSEFMDLADGDIIMTGTPAGVGKVSLGEFNVTLKCAEKALLSHCWQVQS